MKSGHIRLITILLLLLQLLTRCGTALPGELPPEAPDPVEALLESMSLREKVGQLFVVRPEALDGYGSPTGALGVTELTDDMAAALSDCPVGGVAMFAPNIVSPEQTTKFVADLQAASAVPLFIAVDEEGGAVARLAKNPAFGLPRYESPAAVAKSGDSNDALEMGRTIGEYLSRYGFNLDFAPVADVNTNPDNPVIGTRSFSPDPQVAAEMAAAMARGLREYGVIPTFKHFPGHGDTGEDSHIATAVSRKTRGEMEACEWLPFMAAGETDCIMVGHITTPNLTGDMLPASLSWETVTGILRGELGFEGLIVTDALEMGAITNEYGSGGAAVMAFKAGCDILLMPQDLREAFGAVLEAVESGEITLERLDESVARILRFKAASTGLPDAAG